MGVVVSPTVRARPHRESCLFGDDVVSVTTHLAWLVVAPIVGFCEHLSPGKLFFRSMFEGLFCGSDARVRHGWFGFVSC